MKRLIFSTLAGLLLAVPVRTSVAQDSGPVTGVIHTKAGLDMTGTISRSGKDSLEIHFKSPTGAFVTQRVPLANVDHIEISGADKLDAELAKYNADTLSQVLLKWRTQQELLDIEGSIAGAYGLRTAQLLLDTSKPSEAITAGAILQQIIDRDWDEERRDQARTLVIDSLRRSGKHDQTLKAAQDFLATDAGAESKAEVSYYLGLALEDDYRKFIADNPRWASDPIMRPKRDALYNDILDNLLAPYLRYGAPPAATAKSLLAASNFLNECGAPDEAKALAGDIVKIFAAQPEAKEAQKLIKADIGEATN